MSRRGQSFVIIVDGRKLIQSVTDPDGKTVCLSYNALRLRATERFGSLTDHQMVGGIVCPS